MTTIKKLLSKPHLCTEANLIIAHITHNDRAFVLAHPETLLSLWQTIKFYYYNYLLKKGYPWAYITGHKEFFGLDFLVNHHTLIPRPDTELMVEEAINEISKSKFPISNQIQNSNSKNIILIDVGTGTGCIPIAIGKTLKDFNMKIVATDISKKALKVAHKNTKKHGVKINFIHSNLLKNNKILQYINVEYPHHLIITANLPYGWSAWKNNSSAGTKSLKFEPQNALFTGKNGLELYEKLLKQIKDIKHPLTALFEFDPRQTTLLVNLIHDILPDAIIEIKNDLAGRDRLVIIRLNS